MLPQFAPEEFVPHWVAGLSNEDYHSDKTAISSTTLKWALKSPRALHNFLTKPKEEEKPDHFRLGSAIHMAISEPELFEKLHVVMPKFEGTGSRAAKKEFLESKPSDVIFVTEKEKQDLTEIVNSVSRHTEASRLIQMSKPEISGYFREPLKGIKCRIRPDLMSLDLNMILDIKSTNGESSPDAFSRTIWTYRYDFSLFMYSLGYQVITGKQVDFPMFLAVEKSFPYEVALYQADAELMQKGKQDFQRAIELLSDCLINDTWPARQSFNSVIGLPQWAYKGDTL